MPAKKREYKVEYLRQKERNENPARAKRAAARRMLDAEGVDRTGKDVAHIKALSKGGTNARSNITLQSPAKNRSFPRTKTGKMK